MRFPSYPQELGFELLDGEVHISQLQVLSHQSKISSKVELYIGHGGSSYRSATFTRLGYLSLDNNERSSYQARELKTVFIDHSGSYIKLVINENHINKQNIYNQVGIIALSLMGSIDGLSAQPKSSREDGVTGHHHKHHHGAGESAKMMMIPTNPYNDLSTDLNLDPSTASKLRQLADAKARAVEGEDYSTAKQIKTVEQELKALGSKLAQLDMAKADAVMAEDYDLAKDIKDESDQLKMMIETKVIDATMLYYLPSMMLCYDLCYQRIPLRIISLHQLQLAYLCMRPHHHFHPSHPSLHHRIHHFIIVSITPSSSSYHAFLDHEHQHPWSRLR